jgi:Zn-dependent peptidase ImmA (M78 family)
MGIINPHMITLAREYRQVHQKDLCQRVGIVQGTLSKIENGQLTPTNQQLEEIAAALGYPQQFFYRDLEYRNLPQVFFRKYNITQTTAKSVRALLNILRDHVRMLLKSVNMEEDKVPRVALEDYYGSTERLAEQVRLSWNIKPGPISNVTETLEKAGVLIIKCDFGTDKIAGVSMREGELPPLIFVNHNLPGDRWRFTLAHELGHLIMHHHLFLTDRMEVEREGHEFASAFLMPAADIKAHFIGRITLEKLAHLKTLWKTSIQALIMRAAKLDRISESQKRRLFMQLGQLGYRKEEPVSIQREEPRSLVKFHLKDLGYSVDEISKMLCLLPADLSRFYPGVGAPPFRIIKG